MVSSLLALISSNCALQTNGSSDNVTRVREFDNAIPAVSKAASCMTRQSLRVLTPTIKCHNSRFYISTKYVAYYTLCNNEFSVCHPHYYYQVYALTHKTVLH